ncbi:MAG: D-alanyl-D-alanine carboxypeptidase family protein [Geminocystis sp.]|nr:D-alanyl-D-alanine carboxypeptidase family protein [Geminocystis sp.]HIK38286.1 D-alanyl-D-alanine carboxypeptidase family protein [Geminocystis sp. M7585_C2015_104]MCS7148067.1 D-alanyl-D-alanine carboxypeptidase family protein [Geminocystis sp.]MCX8077811.1 D-alanyl-D-alanine carboxypeptidase family protein [Geminocystis sp.]MDW8116419.1 D-alanyl-D-alanine carboxypeptidase family protein [Geminocystis sp.]
MDEIPVAQRETTNYYGQSRPVGRKNLLFGGGTILASLLLWWLVLRGMVPAKTGQTGVESGRTEEGVSKAAPSGEVSDSLLGHLPYEEAPAEELKPITRDGKIRLRKKAADKFLKMQGDAAREGVKLVALSGFRSKKEQEYLFFRVKEQRKQDTVTRAQVSAPPGYSEHHTGYAVDIGDGNAPGTNLSESFEKTEAFRWLRANAARYGFELSFPRHNPQGVSYEPWHWRYVGDSHSLETFYRARQLRGRAP